LAFAYVAVALSALQVLLSANQGNDSTNKFLRGVSFGIGSASMVSIVMTVSVMATLFVTLQMVNATFARRKRADVEGTFALSAFEVPGFKR
jgi:hypothetical protein